MKIASARPTVNDTQETREPNVLKAARLYERHFLREMVKAMRRTVPESEFMPTSMAERIFREELDENYVETWVEKGGIGLGDLIYDQLMDRFPQLKTRIKSPESVNPPVLPQRNGAVQVRPLQSLGEKNAGFEFRFESSEPCAVRSPLQGHLTAIEHPEEGRLRLHMEHGDSLTSVLEFSGQSNGLEVGRSVGPTEPLGLTSVFPGTSRMTWSLRRA